MDFGKTWKRKQKQTDKRMKNEMDARGRKGTSRKRLNEMEK